MIEKKEVMKDKPIEAKASTSRSVIVIDDDEVQILKTVKANPNRKSSKISIKTEKRDNDEATEERMDDSRKRGIAIEDRPSSSSSPCCNKRIKQEEPDDYEDRVATASHPRKLLDPFASYPLLTQILAAQPVIPARQLGCSRVVPIARTPSSTDLFLAHRSVLDPRLSPPSTVPTHASPVAPAAAGDGRVEERAQVQAPIGTPCTTLALLPLTPSSSPATSTTVSHARVKKEVVDPVIPETPGTPLSKAPSTSNSTSTVHSTFGSKSAKKEVGVSATTPDTPLSLPSTGRVLAAVQCDSIQVKKEIIVSDEQEAPPSAQAETLKTGTPLAPSTSLISSPLKSPAKSAPSSVPQSLPSTGPPLAERQCTSIQVKKEIIEQELLSSSHSSSTCSIAATAPIPKVHPVKQEVFEQQNERLEHSGATVPAPTAVQVKKEVRAAEEQGAHASSQVLVPSASGPTAVKRPTVVQVKKEICMGKEQAETLSHSSPSAASQPLPLQVKNEVGAVEEQAASSPALIKALVPPSTSGSVSTVAQSLTVAQVKKEVGAEKDAGAPASSPALAKTPCTPLVPPPSVSEPRSAVPLVSRSESTVPSASGSISTVVQSPTVVKVKKESTLAEEPEKELDFNQLFESFAQFVQENQPHLLDHPQKEIEKKDKQEQSGVTQPPLATLHSSSDPPIAAAPLSIVSPPRRKDTRIPEDASASVLQESAGNAELEAVLVRPPSVSSSSAATRPVLSPSKQGEVVLKPIQSTFADELSDEHCDLMETDNQASPSKESDKSSSNADEVEHKIDEEEEEEYDVEKILDKRMTENGDMEYLIKWEGQCVTWENARHVKSCAKLIQEFEQRISEMKKKAMEIEEKPQLKRRSSRVKTEEPDEDVKPPKRRRSSRVKTEEPDEDVKPQVRRRSTRIKTEEPDEEENNSDADFWSGKTPSCKCPQCDLLIGQCAITRQAHYRRYHYSIFYNHAPNMCDVERWVSLRIGGPACEARGGLRVCYHCPIDKDNKHDGRVGLLRHMKKEHSQFRNLKENYRLYSRSRRKSLTKEMIDVNRILC